MNPTLWIKILTFFLFFFSCSLGNKVPQTVKSTLCCLNPFHTPDFTAFSRKLNSLGIASVRALALACMRPCLLSSTLKKESEYIQVGLAWCQNRHLIFFAFKWAQIFIWLLFILLYLIWKDGCSSVLDLMPWLPVLSDLGGLLWHLWSLNDLFDRYKDSFAVLCQRLGAVTRSFSPENQDYWFLHASIILTSS